MNIRTIFAAMAVVAAGSAAASDIYPYVDHGKYMVTRTRADVQAELSTAGPVTARLKEFDDQSGMVSVRTRSEVRAELERDYAEGNRVSDRSPEFVDFTYAASTRSREDVQREAIEAARAPEGNASSGG